MIILNCSVNARNKYHTGWVTGIHLNILEKETDINEKV